MKLVLDHFVQFGAGPLLDLNEFKGITVEVVDEDRYQINFISSVTQSLYGSTDEVKNLSCDFIGLYSDWKYGNESSITPPKGFIDYTQEWFKEDGSRFVSRGLLNVMCIQGLFEDDDNVLKIEMGTDESRIPVCESYDIIVERMREVQR